MEDAKDWHLLTMAAVNRAKVRITPFDKPVIITFYWNDALDVDNHAVMGKCITDALKKRVIHNDSRKWLKGVEHYFHDEPYIKVVIREA